MTNQELKHYGVLGMKWGRRKSQYSTSTDHDRARELSKKHVSEMSNQELQALNKRQELESKHRQLNPSAVKRGIAVVASVAAGLGAVALLYDNSRKTVNMGKNIYNGYRKMKAPNLNSTAAKAVVDIVRKK